MVLAKSGLCAVLLLISLSIAGQNPVPSAQQLDAEISQLFDKKERNPSSSLSRAYTIDEIAQEEGYHKVRIRCLNLISVIHMDQGFHHMADSSLFLAHEISTIYNDSLLMGSTLINWAQLNMKTSDYLSATDKVLRAKSIFEKKGRLKGEIHCSYVLAQVHYHRQLYDEAYDDLSWGIDQSAELKDTILLASGLVNLGIIQKRQEQIDAAITSFERSSSLLSQSLEKGDIVQSWLNLASIYADQGKEAQTLEYYNRVRTTELYSANELNLAEAFIARSKLGLKIEDYKQSLLFADSALGIAERLAEDQILIRVLDIKHQSFAASGDYSSAYEVLNLKNSLQDSTVTQVNKREINDLEKKYRDAEKDREILQLQANQLEQDKSLERLLFILIGSLMVFGIFGGLYIFRNRQRMLTNRFDKLELEQKALKAQMNPHFLFNALNSIQSSILNEDRMIAYEYHNKFTKLMRRILTLSREEFVSIRDELETLKLYIDLEKFRSDDAFSVVYEIDESINLDLQKTPSLLFQPYVENAIWHGLMPKDVPGTLLIKMARSGESIECFVRDNGLGRTGSQEKKSRRKSQHESVGMEVTEARIQLFNRKHGKKIAVHITDLAENGRPAGTEVQFSLPLLEE